jgi:CheY-like chemotaxis protein
VLIIEDNDDARSMLKHFLLLDGHTVHEAQTGPSGVRMALDTKPQLAIIDIGLPGCDGYAVARAIRAQLDGRIRLVAVTGYGSSEDRARSREAGFDEHLVKPVDPAALARVLASLECAIEAHDPRQDGRTAPA